LNPKIPSGSGARVLFLASPEASYITGHTLPVTGGR
jgi:NAD(P)-dependent dehydrogenase (short-subunit alcohol dehydrogenase family)